MKDFTNKDFVYCRNCVATIINSTLRAYNSSTGDLFYNLRLELNKIRELDKYLRDCQDGLFSQDIQDLISQAITSYLTFGDDKSAIYQDLNKYIYSNKKRDYKNIYIDDESYDIEKSDFLQISSIESCIDLTKATSDYIKYIAERVNLTTTQVKVLKCWVDGYSIKATAQKINRAEQTIASNRALIKTKIQAYLSK